jgi:hypothetical protein
LVACFLLFCRSPRFHEWQRSQEYWQSTFGTREQDLHIRRASISPRDG